MIGERPSGGKTRGSHLDRHAFADLMYLDDGSSARVSSFDRTGGNNDFIWLAPGQTRELASIAKAGCIEHLYFTVNQEGVPGLPYLRDLVLRMYWDGEAEPSVEAPLGDFFGLGHERICLFSSLLVTVNPGNSGGFRTLGFNSYFPMPFRDGARITLANDGDHGCTVWYHVDYQGLDGLPEDLGRFHAQWRRENPTGAVGARKNMSLHDGTNTDGAENYLILEAWGRGKLVGYFLHIDNVAGGWYGEGDDMIFVDGEGWPPSIHGTGTEEIFGGGGCPAEEFAGPYTGFPLISEPSFGGKNSMYRFFVTDPIRFQQELRVSIEHGHANNFENDYSSTAFWYQTEPHRPFPPLPGPALRRTRAQTSPRDRAFWKVEELRSVLSAGETAARAGGPGLPPLEGAAAMELREHTLPQLLRARDYDRILRECERAIESLRRRGGTAPRGG